MGEWRVLSSPAFLILKRRFPAKQQRPLLPRHRGDLCGRGEACVVSPRRSSVGECVSVYVCVCASVCERVSLVCVCDRAPCD